MKNLDFNVSQGGRYNNRVDSVVDIIRPRPKKDMTHEISSTTSCTSHESDHARYENATDIQNNYTRIPKNSPAIDDRQISTWGRNFQNSSSSKKRKYRIPYPREKRSSTFDRLFQSTFEHLPLPSLHNIPPTTTLEMKLAKTIIVQKKEVSHSLSSRGEILHLRSTPSNTFEHLPLASIPSQHSLLSALHNSGNVSKHSLTFHLFDEKNDPTRSSNRPLKSDHQPCHASGAEARYRGGETWLAYLATRWTARRSRRAGGCIYEGARLGEASVIGIDVPRRRSASSREHERVLTAAGLDGLAVRRESGGYVLVTREALARWPAIEETWWLSDNLGIRNLSNR